MIITAHKTHKIKARENLSRILDTYLPPLEERTIVAIASTVISTCQGDLVKNDGTVDKKELIRHEADLYVDVDSDYGVVMPTIKNSVFIANAGVDESNGNGSFVLWPKHLQQTTDEIWQHVRNKHGIRELGVIVTDSRLMPMTWGIMGVGISWCGFEPLKDYRGKPDLFGRLLKMEQTNIVNGFAAAAVVVMGEGDEQTPLATITEIPTVVFKDRPPKQEELDALKIEPHNDIYSAFLTSVKWKKGGQKK